MYLKPHTIDKIVYFLKLDSNETRLSCRCIFNYYHNLYAATSQQVISVCRQQNNPIFYIMAFCFMACFFIYKVKILKIENRRGEVRKWDCLGGVVGAATPDYAWVKSKLFLGLYCKRYQIVFYVPHLRGNKVILYDL